MTLLELIIEAKATPQSEKKSLTEQPLTDEEKESFVAVTEWLLDKWAVWMAKQELEDGDVTIH